MITKPFISIVLGLAVVGCSGVVVQDEPAPRGNYHERDFDYATRKGAIVTIVAGNPFGGPQKDFDAQVRRLMYEQNRELPADFVAGPSDRTSPPYKVVVAFNKRLSVSPDEMCRDPLSLPVVPEGKKTRIDIAFCHGDRSKSDTSGYAQNVSGANDPVFVSLVQQATFTMLPEEGETDRDRASENSFR